MPRLLYVCNDFNYFMLHWHERARYACLHGYEVGVAVPLGPVSRPDHSIPFEWFDFPLQRRSLNPFREIPSIFTLKRIISKYSPHLIHSCTVKPNLYTALACRDKDTPLIMSITGLGSVFSRSTATYAAAQKTILKAYAGLTREEKTWFLFENRDDRKLFLDAEVGLEDFNILVPGAGVDMNRFRVGKEENSKAVKIILPARMLWDKGVKEFVEAAEIIHNKGIAARFILAGDPDPGSRGTVPVTRLREWNNRGTIEWWGHCEEMEKVLSGAQVVCLPTCYREGIPRVLIEAAACGRPLVTTDSPGCREIVRHGENGFLVEKRDVEGLTNALEILIKDTGLRKEFGARSRIIAEKEYSQEVVIKRSLEVYSRALESV